MPRDFMTYAIVIVEDREIPAVQCTKHFPPALREAIEQHAVRGRCRHRRAWDGQPIPLCR